MKTPWLNTQATAREIDAIYAEHLKPVRLTPIQAHVLAALFERDGQHASALAKAVGRAPTSFTPNLDSLAELGLIERRNDSFDRRAVWIVLTPAGVALRADVARAMQAAQLEAEAVSAGRDEEARHEQNGRRERMPAP